MLRYPGPLDTGGLGLHIVESLSLRWGWAPLAPYGKIVWAVLRPAHPEDPNPSNRQPAGIQVPRLQPNFLRNGAASSPSNGADWSREPPLLPPAVPGPVRTGPGPR